MSGKLDVLHSAHGHLELEFKTPQQAGDEINGLMRRGFLIIVTIDGEDHKVTSFDSNTGEYVVREVRRVWASHKTVEERVPFEEGQARAIAPDPLSTPPVVQIPPLVVPPLSVVLPAVTTVTLEETDEVRRIHYKEAKVTAIPPVAGG